MKICLLMPGRGQITNRMHPESRSWLPPGSLLEVAGMTAPEHELVLIDELAQGSVTLGKLPEADLYALSGLSTSRYGAYRIADFLRKQGKLVVAGGMDVTGHYSEGHGEELFDHYDAIAVGRLTSQLWAQVLADCQKGTLKPVYQVSPDEPWEFPVPRYDLINPRDYFLPVAIRTSAGCNEACPFCTIHLVIGRRRTIRTKPPAILEKELEILPPSKYLVDYSDSFGADYPHTLEILPLLRDTGRPWFTEITVKNLLGIDRPGELIGPMVRNGCAGVYLGFENIRQSVSGKSLTQKQNEEACRRIQGAGLIILGSFILDVTGREDVDTINWTVEWAAKVRLDFVQYSLLALLPGSELRRIALQKGWVIDNNPEHFDGAWPTIAHPLSPEQRIESLCYAYRQTYSLRNIAERLRGFPANWRQARLLPLVAAANYQIHRSVAAREQWGTYEHWLATRQVAVQSV